MAKNDKLRGKKTINSGAKYFAALINALFISLLRVGLLSFRRENTKPKRRRFSLFRSDKTKWHKSATIPNILHPGIPEMPSVLCIQHPLSHVPGAENTCRQEIQLVRIRFGIAWSILCYFDGNSLSCVVCYWRFNNFLTVGNVRVLTGFFFCYKKLNGKICIFSQKIKSMGSTRWIPQPPVNIDFCLFSLNRDFEVCPSVCSFVAKALIYTISLKAYIIHVLLYHAVAMPFDLLQCQHIGSLRTTARTHRFTFPCFESVLAASFTCTVEQNIPRGSSA